MVLELKLALSYFSAEEMGDPRRTFLVFFFDLQCGKPLSSPRVRGINFEKLGINCACASRKVHFLERFGELNVDWLPPWIEIDGLVVILG